VNYRNDGKHGFAAEMTAYYRKIWPALPATEPEPDDNALSQQVTVDELIERIKAEGLSVRLQWDEEDERIASRVTMSCRLGVVENITGGKNDTSPNKIIQPLYGHYTEPEKEMTLSAAIATGGVASHYDRGPHSRRS
jgi:hypothetical protein